MAYMRAISSAHLSKLKQVAALASPGMINGGSGHGWEPPWVLLSSAGEGGSPSIFVGPRG